MAAKFTPTDNTGRETGSIRLGKNNPHNSTKKQQTCWSWIEPADIEPIQTAQEQLEQVLPDRFEKAASPHITITQLMKCPEQNYSRIKNQIKTELDTFVGDQLVGDGIYVYPSPENDPDGQLPYVIALDIEIEPIEMMRNRQLETLTQHSGTREIPGVSTHITLFSVPRDENQLTRDGLTKTEYNTLQNRLSDPTALDDYSSSIQDIHVSTN